MNFLSQQSGSKPDTEEDKLFSLGQRFTYFQDKSPANKTVDIVNPQPFHLRRTIRPPARYKNSRMTVRLRPRQVLCSKCRSICNENSENVDLSRKRNCLALLHCFQIIIQKAQLSEKKLFNVCFVFL